MISGSIIMTMEVNIMAISGVFLLSFFPNNVDILAIVDSKGKCTGSLSDREVLLGLGTVANEVPT